MNTQSLQKQWRELMAVKLQQVKTLKEIEDQDSNVRHIVGALRNFYRHKIDTVPMPELANIGANLLGHYLSVATTTSHIRAERDAAEQAYEEMMASTTLIFKSEESGVGITEARALAKEQLGEFAAEVIWREQRKNAYEAITDTAEKTVSFIQSILKIKLSERANVRLEGEVA